jgi:tetratricopeptide (TPR) repeat protein
LTSVALAMTLASSAAFAQTANESAALLRFQRGRELFVANDFNGALTEFRAANQLVGSPNTRLYIARCLRELGQLGEAYIEFQRAAAEAADRSQSEPRYAATRDAARQDMEALRPRIGQLTLRAPHAPEGLEVRVGGVLVPTAMLDVPTPTTPGVLEITATAPGRIAYRQQVTVRAGATTEQAIELRVDPNYVPPSNRNASRGDSNGAGPDSERAPPAQPRLVPVTEGGGVRIGGLVVGALGLGALGAFVGLGVMASGRFTELQTLCGNAGGCGPEWNAEIARGEQLQLFANLSLGLGSAALVAGTVMVIVGGPRERMVPEGEASQRAMRSIRSRWTAFALPSQSGLTGGVLGTF